MALGLSLTCAAAAAPLAGTVADGVTVGAAPSLLSDPSSEGDATVLAPRVRHYDYAEGDGVYGRFLGDLDFYFGLGASYSGNVNPALKVGAWYFWSVGLMLSHVEPLHPRAQARHTALELQIRPLFLPRWSEDLEHGPAFWDLTLDSLALGVGPVLASGRYGHAAQTGVQASLGFGFPLFSSANGPWLEVQGIRRWLKNDEHLNALLFYLSWHSLFSSGLLAK